MFLKKVLMWMWISSARDVEMLARCWENSKNPLPDICLSNLLVREESAWWSHRAVDVDKATRRLEVVEMMLMMMQ
jgi:hypothetical protein